MSFDLRVTFPLDDEWIENTNLVCHAAVPFQPIALGQGQCEHMDNGREIIFLVKKFENAIKLKRKIVANCACCIDGLQIAVREAI